MFNIREEIHFSNTKLHVNIFSNCKNKYLIPLECSLLDDTAIRAVMLLRQSGELVLNYPYLSILKTM